MRFLTTSLLATFLLFSAPQTLAEALKIGVVDVQALFNQAPQMQQAQEALKAEFEPLQKELQSEADGLRKQKEELDKNRAVLPAEDVAAQEDQLQNQLQALQLKFKQLQGQADKKKKQVVAELEVSIAKIIKQYATDQGYDLILTTQVAAYVGPKADITAAIVQLLRTAK